MSLDFNTPSSLNQGQAKGGVRATGRGPGWIHALVLVSLAFTALNLFFLIKIQSKVHPQKPVLVQCDPSEISQLQRSGDILEGIEKNLKITQ